MAVTSIKRDQSNNVSIVRITVDTDIAILSTPNYIRDQQETINDLNGGFWQWFFSDTLLISANDANAFFEFTDETFSTIEQIAPSLNGIVNSGLKNQVAYYGANGNTISGKRSSTTNTIYVAPAPFGDNTGDGSILAPFASLSHAISTVTTASPTNPFEICMQIGSYSDSSLALKPDVNVNGQGSSLTIIGSITADASWSVGGSIQFGNFSSISTSSGFNFDVTSAASQCILSFEKMRFLSGNTFNIFGGLSSDSILVLNEIYSFSGDLNILVENFYGGLNNCSLNNFTYLATSNLSGYSFQISQSSVYNICSFDSTLISLGVLSYISSSKLLGTLNANGANTNLNIDSSSLIASSLPNITSGANVQYINVSNTLTANYSPVNYIPDATGTSPVTSVAAHFHGIDNKFGLLAAIVTNDIYVSNQGSDGSGNGTLDNPYQTISFAMSQITTNSSTNYFKIICTQGIYIESSLIFKPYVFVDGRNSILTVDSVELENNFIDGGDLIFENFFKFTCAGGTLKFDAGSSTQPVILGINNILSEIGFDINITGSNSSAYTYLYLNSVQTTIGTINFNITDCAGEMNNCLGKNYEYTALNPSVSFYFSQKNNYFFGGVNVINSGGSGVQSVWNSNKIDGAFNASGSLSILLDSNTSSASSVPSLSGGATLTYLNVADTLSANFSPSNYTALDASVKGNLQGIDNKLGTLTGSYSTSLPTITASTGFGSVLLSRSIIQRIGDTCSMTCYFVCNPSSTTCDFTVAAPFMVGNFSNALECVGNGTFYRLAGASLATMGAILDVASISGSQNIKVSVLSQSTGVSHVASVNFNYKIA